MQTLACIKTGNSMYSECISNVDDEIEREEWKQAGAGASVPRGIVGLVGPYRIYKNPNERREFMLQEEELIEEVVDSVSEAAAAAAASAVTARVAKVAETEQQQQQHVKPSRAKWRIRDEDEETLVPELRETRRRSLEDIKPYCFVNGVNDKCWNNHVHGINSNNNNNNKWDFDNNNIIRQKILEVIDGKEERAVDVPPSIVESVYMRTSKCM